MPGRNQILMLKDILDSIDWLTLSKSTPLAAGDDFLSDTLPLTQGTQSVPGIGAPVTVEWDETGIPRLSGKSREDVSFALGFVHAQERFFQMDTLRRLAAGELAALVGAGAVSADKQNRRWQLRALAKKTVSTLPAYELATLTHYTQGVNSGMATQKKLSFEYGLLPKPTVWRVEDCLLVLWALAIELQANEIPREYARGWIAENTTAMQCRFLLPDHCQWDVPVMGGQPGAPAQQPDTPPVWWGKGHKTSTVVPSQSYGQGSNAWAVSSQHSQTHQAMLANDMHLSLMLPNLWYRAELRYPRAGGAMMTLTGLTLPGVPLMVVGSNDDVAWGFTNAYADTFDWVQVSAPATGWPMQTETIEVFFGEPVTFSFPLSPWGPVVNTALGEMAMRWVMQLPGSVSLNALEITEATSVAQAIGAGQRSAIPALNMVAVDRQGHLGWTLAGTLPDRSVEGETNTFPVESTNTWHTAPLSAAKHPSVVDPAEGILFITNNRQGFGAGYDVIGDGGADIGVRAWEIRRRLGLSTKTTPDDMRSIQLDDYAPLLELWRGTLVTLVGPSWLENHPLRKQAMDYFAQWSGNAAVDSVGYRLLSRWRDEVYRTLFGELDAQLTQQWPQASYLMANSRWDETVMRVIASDNPHWLPAPYRSWADFVVAQLDAVVAAAVKEAGSLEKASWGEVNKASIMHPIAKALGITKGLSVPADPLSGDHNVPHVNRPGFGASCRLVVSPGDRDSATLVTPGGQSGHPLSPWFLAGHEHWVKGTAFPLKAGEVKSTLTLMPGA